MNESKIIQHKITIQLKFDEFKPTNKSVTKFIASVWNHKDINWNIKSTEESKIGVYKFTFTSFKDYYPQSTDLKKRINELAYSYLRPKK